MVVREAANAGTPSVTIKGSSSAEIMKDGVNGFCCEDDSESLAHVLIKALSDPKKTREIGLNAKETIPVSWDKIIDKVLERYQYLIDEHKKLL